MKHRIGFLWMAIAVVVVVVHVCHGQEPASSDSAAEAMCAVNFQETST